MSNQANLQDSFTTSGSESNSPQMMLDYYQLFISQADNKRVVFEEKLVLMDASGQPLDEVTVAVEEEGEDSFTVYQYSLDENRLMRVQSRVYRNLETDTELRRIRQQEQSKMLRVTDSGQKYRVFLLSVAGQEGWREKLEYTKSPTDLLLLEGSNILILRKLAINQLFGQLRGQALNHEGELCECEYHVERGDGSEVVVRRVVIPAEQGESEVMTTVLSREGRILLHRWSSSDWYLVTENPTHKTDSKNLPLLEEELVTSEVEIKADKDAYFTKKEELILLMNTYLKGQPDVQDMIADFLKNLLFDKPDDVVDFADTFFSEFVGINWSFEELASVSNSKPIVSLNAKERGPIIKGPEGRRFVNADLLNVIDI